MKKLQRRWGDRVQFVDILIRQAHPGGDAGPYRSFEEKLRDARRYKEAERISRPVLADELEGTVHQVYGGLADPTYLIDAEGRVSYYGMWTNAPNLHQAIGALVDQEGRGVVNGGVDHVVHLLPSMTDGWRGISRGLPQSYDDLEAAVPGLGRSLEAGYRMRSLLAPVTLRAERLPRLARAIPIALVLVLLTKRLLKR
jgi:hypothetical protein